MGARKTDIEIGGSSGSAMLGDAAGAGYGTDT